MRLERTMRPPRHGEAEKMDYNGSASGANK